MTSPVLIAGVSRLLGKRMDRRQSARLADATTARDDRRHLAKKTADLGRNARQAGRGGASWLPMVGILAAVVLVTQAWR